MFFAENNDYLKDKYFYYRGVLGSIKFNFDMQMYEGELIKEFYNDGWRNIEIENCHYCGYDIEELMASFSDLVDQYFNSKDYNIGETFFNKV